MGKGRALGSLWERVISKRPRSAVERTEVREVKDRTDEQPRVDGGQPGTPTAEAVMESLKEVHDPELAINIVDLGLVYGVEIEDRSVRVRMTLTSPGCPIGPMLQALVHGAVSKRFPDVKQVHVDLVWSPPWDPYSMASEEAKDALGIW
ncbi:MAG: metal-sulfur cluster assembly factor [Sphingomonadaceae bacterium]